MWLHVVIFMSFYCEVTTEQLFHRPFGFDVRMSKYSESTWIVEAKQAPYCLSYWPWQISKSKRQKYIKGYNMVAGSQECMCHLRNIAVRDYQESVTTKSWIQDKKTSGKVISMCGYALQAKQKIEFNLFNVNTKFICLILSQYIY